MVIYTVKGFSVVNEAEVDVFLEFSCFFYDPTNVGKVSLQCSLNRDLSESHRDFQNWDGLKSHLTLRQGVKILYSSQS